MKRWFVVAMGTMVILAAGASAAAQKKTEEQLPYKAIHEPQFIAASAATYLRDEDRVIGVTIGSEAKAYPAGILAQHGLVEDESPSGPIAVTW